MLAVVVQFFFILSFTLHYCCNVYTKQQLNDLREEGRRLGPDDRD